MTHDGSDAKRNVLVVCVDCLREDHLATDAADTPFLETLRDRGVVATNCFATATTTTPCVASLLTGTYSERNGVLSLETGRLDPDLPSFATLFGAAGYHTEAFVTGPLVEETGLQRGFDSYRYREPEESLFSPWRDTAARRLAALPEPFAAYLHLWEIHEPIEVPPPYDDPAYGVTPYARALSALDRELQALYAAVPDDTIVVIHGDHGESITHRHSPVRLVLKSLRDACRYYGGIDTRGVVGKLNRALAARGSSLPDHYIENGHGENVFDFVSNVPFTLSGPGIESETIDAQVRQIDVLPTLLDVASIPSDAPFDGESILVEDLSARPAYMRACGASLRRRRNWAKAVRVDGKKYVEYPDRSLLPELYLLEDDPVELHPIMDPDDATRLRHYFPEKGLGESEDLDIEERLQDLGYL